MKCSAWKSWSLVNDEMTPKETCPNDAVYLLSYKPHWENQPYCDNCAYWIMNGPYNHVYADGIAIEEI